MLDLYLSSIIVWFIILFSEGVVFNDLIHKNGWLGPQKKSNIIRILFGYILIAAVPILRLIAAIMFFVMATCTKERYDKFVELKNKDDE